MKHTLSMIAACCLLSAGTAFGDGPAVSASHVWIRTAPVGVLTLSGYMTLENLTDKPLQILDITSPGFGSVDISPAAASDHTQNTPVKAFTLPPHQPVTFKPDTEHLQLKQPHQRLFDGDMVTLTFKFSDGSQLSIFAPVRRESPASN
jgi:periplasmic copper chaperone A